MKTALFKKQHGFTLIELLVVMTIIVALAVTVFTALNPGQRLKNARDARRTSDVDTILTAVHQYIVDNKGSAPAGLSTSEQQLGTAGTGCAIATGGCNVVATACLDLSTPLAAYLKSIPVDPLNGTTATTKYSIVQDVNGIVTVRACSTGTGTTEGTTNISASR
jgi:prepilin-type N-terminal cleavage/methylation domain-containing protein